MRRRRRDARAAIAAPSVFHPTRRGFLRATAENAARGRRRRRRRRRLPRGRKKRRRHHVLDNHNHQARDEHEHAPCETSSQDDGFLLLLLLRRFGGVPTTTTIIITTHESMMRWSRAPQKDKRAGLSFQSVLSLSLSEEKKEELFKGGNDFLGSCLGFLGFRERCFFFESEEGLRGEMSNLRQKKKHNTHTVRRRLYTSREREKREGKRERRRRRRPSFTSSPSPSLPLSHFFLGGGGRFGRRKREDH